MDSGKRSCASATTETTEFRVVRGSWGSAPFKSPSFTSSPDNLMSLGVDGPTCDKRRRHLRHQGALSSTS
eukprot:scaffold1626_cov372-Prasinococcus_capsulatus_cf.AAC.9